MGQVPNATVDMGHRPGGKVLVIGDGRLATALIDSLSELKQLSLFPAAPFLQWSRRAQQSGENKSLAETISDFNPTHIWLAISDGALATFVADHGPLFKDRTMVHFAGSLPSFDGIWSAHPLTTFARKSESSLSGSRTDFSKIPFVIDIDGPELSDLMPGFQNPSHRLDPKQRAYYHALCAIAGNFTVLLWESVGARFENQLSLPAEILENYRSQIFENLARASAASAGATKTSVLTGPLVRGDFATIAAHHRALLEKFEMPLLKIYDGFTDLYTTERSSRENGS